MLRVLPNCEALQLHHGDDDDNNNGEYSLGVGLYFGATSPECLGKEIEHKQNTGRYTVYAVCECGAIQADQLAAFQTSNASACKNNLFNKFNLIIAITRRTVTCVKRWIYKMTCVFKKFVFCQPCLCCLVDC